MRKLLFRLLKKQEDVSYEVVGYEKHILWYNPTKKEGVIHIIHASNMAILDAKVITLLNGGYAPNDEISHDRKDQYTGRDLSDGTKVFERDGGLLDGHIKGDTPVTVVYSPPCFKVRHADGELYELNEYFYKITSIEGVKDEV